MSDDYNLEDFARLLALEHAFYSVALISASNFAFLAKIKPSEAVAQFRSATESSVFDKNDIPNDVKQIMRIHLKRMFDHVSDMEKHVDKGH